MAAKKKDTSVPQGTPAPGNPSEGTSLLARYKVKRQVILPTLNLAVGFPRVLKILEAMHVSTISDPKAAEKAGKAGEKMEPATVCPVTDIETGEQFNLLVPAVLRGNIEEKYPDAAYVGAAFYVEKLPKRPGKRYFDFKLIEVEAGE